MRYHNSKLKGFTLIELLIVVAIIAILAAIAIPNFLAAQVRSKVSRVKAEMRTVATALESYYVDNNEYPMETAALPRPAEFWGPAGILPLELSTPIAYISNARFKDPFKRAGQAADEEVLTYHNIRNRIQYSANPHHFWIPARDIAYGDYRMASIGPDSNYWNHPTIMGCPHIIEYDPTNGTVSYGNIWRSQKRTDAFEWRGTTPYFVNCP